MIDIETASELPSPARIILFRYQKVKRKLRFPVELWQSEKLAVSSR